ncbi:MAG: cell division protein ZapE [Nitrospiraceae bacterium]|nr:cell division protein ZapE [Nitrospiraceae bacterium]MDA8262042.1 cell division protein ZapE [Actinomycetota bacterium]
MDSHLSSLRDRKVDFDVRAAVELLAPPPRFAGTSFENYRPNRHFPSQAEAVQSCRAFAASLSSTQSSRRGLLSLRRQARPLGRGIYLDGGFGVGKTHLLGAIYRESPEPKAYLSFVDLVNFVGAIGFERAVQELSGYVLVAVDEFELDDPGETVLVSSLLDRLASAGVNLAATSNTLPDRLGEGRFAAVDFMREIQGLAARFQVVSIDGPDYRHRRLNLTDVDVDGGRLLEMARARNEVTTLDRFDLLLAKLAATHPVMYSRLIDGVDLALVEDGRTFSSLDAALRFVVLVDRAYETGTSLVVAGVRLQELFPEPFMKGGYRKKFGRALSRLSQLREEAEILPVRLEGDGPADESAAEAG